MLRKRCQAHKAVRRCSLLSRDSSTAFCTQRPAPQPSTGWETALVFFDSRASARQTVPMCTSTWSHLTMQDTQQRYNRPVSLILESLRAMWETKTTRLEVTWTWPNTAQYPYGASDSALTSGPRR